MFKPPAPTKAPQIKTIELNNWKGGVQTANDDGRTPLDGLRSGGNIMLSQDGTVRPRPSLTRPSNIPQPTGTIQGEVFEFRNLSGLTFTNWMISLQRDSGVTNVYICKSGDTSWTKCTASVTYSTTAKAHFCQIQNKVLIMNGTDTLSYLDIPTSTVSQFTSILKPTGLGAVNNGSSDLTTGTKPFTLYYVVTANSTVGETEASTPVSIAVNKDRDFWDPATNSLKVTWSAVTNARSYNVYAGIAASGAGSPTLYRIASGLSADSQTFIDNGSYSYQLINTAPTINSTAGPKVSRGTVINGRVFMVGDYDKPYYVWYGGDPGFELDFSPANGGGFTPVGNGTANLPINIKPFHQGKGDPGIFVLQQGTNGTGKRSVLTPDSISYGGETITFYSVSEDNGGDGTDSPDGIILYQDALWYPSRDGFKTTRTKPQLQNINSTDRVSNTIQPDIASLNTNAMGGCVGLAFEGRLYWAVPTSSSTNNEIWVLDLDRDGAWMKPWNISADWMWLYNDNDGKTHFCILKNNVIYELASNQYTNDDGAAFSTSGNSGQLTFSKDGRTWARLLNVIFVLLRPQGTFLASVSGEGDSGAVALVGSESFTPRTSVSGWDEPTWVWDRPLRAWDTITSVPESFNSATQEVKVEVDEDLKWFNYSWLTTGNGVNYNLSKVVATYVEIGNKDL